MNRKPLALALASVLGLGAAPTMAQLMLEEVVVTAQKREQGLQDISATVNVVGGETIEEYSALNFEDVEGLTAGLTLESPNARQQKVALRGVSIDPDSGADGTVDIYWNGQLVNPAIAFSKIYDMERIEVLRGPQGTLQGRSSPGGAILLLTRKADLNEASGYVQGTVGDNDGFNTQVAYGAPLIENTLAVRVAAVYDMDDGNGVENATTGLDNPEQEAASARLSVTWAPVEDVTAALTYQFFDQEADDVQAIDGMDSLGVRPSFDAQDRTGLAPTDNEYDFEFDALNLNLTWDLGNHEVVSVTGWDDQTREYRDENDRADYIRNPLAFSSQNSVVEQEVFTQEIRIASIDNEMWNYVVGAYYQDSDVLADFVVNTTTTLPDSTPVIGPYQFTLATRSLLPVTAEQWSLFSFNTINLSDDLQVELGIRYTDYDKGRSATVDFLEFTYLPEVMGLPPGVPQEAALGPITEGVAGGLPIEGISPENQESSEDAFTGSATVRWEATDEMAVYASYSRSYRPSGTSIVPSPNVQFLPGGGDFVLHEEEESDAIEFGFKGAFWDGRAEINGAVFLQQYDGFLGFVRGVEVLDDNGDAQILPGGIIFNGDAEILGVEMDGRVLLSETWSAGFSAAWVDAQWDGGEQPCNDREPGEVVGSCELDGQIEGEPEWSFSLNSEYYMPLDNGMETYVRGLYKYTGERGNIAGSAGVGDVTDEFEAHNVVDLFIGVRDAAGSWDVNVFAKNLFDEDEVVRQLGPDQYDQRFSGGSYTLTDVLEERTIGVTGRYNF